MVYHNSSRLKFVTHSNAYKFNSLNSKTYCAAAPLSHRREQMSHSELRTNSQEMDSTEKTTEANSHRMPPVQKMPTKFELEEFFTEAEKDIQKCFAEK